MHPRILHNCASITRSITLCAQRSVSVARGNPFFFLSPSSIFPPTIFLFSCRSSPKIFSTYFGRHFSLSLFRFARSESSSLLKKFQTNEKTSVAHAPRSCTFERTFTDTNRPCIYARTDTRDTANVPRNLTIFGDVLDAASSIHSTRASRAVNHFTRDHPRGCCIELHQRARPTRGISCGSKKKARRERETWEKTKRFLLISLQPQNHVNCKLKSHSFFFLRLSWPIFGESIQYFRFAFSCNGH